MKGPDWEDLTLLRLFLLCGQIACLVAFVALVDLGPPPPEGISASLLVLRKVVCALDALPFLITAQICVVAEIEMLLLEQFLDAFQLFDHVSTQWWTVLAVGLNF